MPHSKIPDDLYYIFVVHTHTHTYFLLKLIYFNECAYKIEGNRNGSTKKRKMNETKRKYGKKRRQVVKVASRHEVNSQRTIREASVAKEERYANR